MAKSTKKPKRKPQPKYDIFLSYSRQHLGFIDPILKLLQVGGRKVFVDNQIEPGKEWEKELKNALATSNQVALLWCCHSAESEWVRREVEATIAMRKPLVPMLLCDRSIPSDVSAFQWLDLRPLITHHCSAMCIISRVSRDAQSQSDSECLSEPPRIALCTIPNFEISIPLDQREKVTLIMDSALKAVNNDPYCFYPPDKTAKG